MRPQLTLRPGCGSSFVALCKALLGTRLRELNLSRNPIGRDSGEPSILCVQIAIGAFWYLPQLTCLCFYLQAKLFSS